MKTIPLIFAVFAVLMPFLTQKTGLSQKYGLKIKMLCAFMYLVTGVISAFAVRPVTYYAVFILSALVSGFLGDFFLSYKNDRYFPIGVGFFALGHIVYSITFLFVGKMNASGYIIPVAVMTVILYLPVICVIKKKINLGKMEIPILIYALLLLFSFACGIAKGITAIQNADIISGLCLVSASVLFVVSDILLGLKSGGMKLPDMLRHAVTYTYFPAQTLFALSIYFQ